MSSFQDDGSSMRSSEFDIENGSDAMLDNSRRSDAVLHCTIDEDAEYASGGFSIEMTPSQERSKSKKHNSPFVALPPSPLTKVRVVNPGERHVNDHSSGSTGFGSLKESGSVSSSSTRRQLSVSSRNGSGRRLSAAPGSSKHLQTPKQRRYQEILNNKKSSGNINPKQVSRRKVPGAGTGLPGNSFGASESSDSMSEKVVETNRPPSSTKKGGLPGFGNSCHGKKKKSFLSSKIHGRTRLKGFANTSKQSQSRNEVVALSQSGHDASLVNRKYKVGEYVLIRNLHYVDACLVNRYGFPPNEGDSKDELRGPYIYSAAKVRQMHSEESNPYYTVTRCDNNTEQRADIQFMLPIRNPKGQVSALRAAIGAGGDSQHRWFQDDTMNPGDECNSIDDQSAIVNRGAIGKLWHLLQGACFYLILPVLWIFDGVRYVWGTLLADRVKQSFQYVKSRARLFLYGSDPFVCRARLTATNFVVVCSTWYMFIDQARLAFFPPSSDDVLASVNFGVWCVLVVELLFEIFIRPNGYQGLIVSDKAYAPTTVRYINGFQFFVEALSLGLFIPEFCCMFTGKSCSKRVPFSFHNAVVIGTFGPSTVDVFCGHAFIALIRLRVFGLVRHWKNMWITNTFINMKWKSKQTGMLSNIVPPSNNKSFTDRSKPSEKKRSLVNSTERERKRKEAALTNASNIGTALMSTNSYRALAILWAIVGLFPAIVSFAFVNPVASRMTDHLQATNLLSSDTSNTTCAYLASSIQAWLTGISSNLPVLLTLDILPYRCSFDSSIYTNVQSCSNIDTFAENLPSEFAAMCNVTWLEYTKTMGVEDIADVGGIRVGSIVEYERSNAGTLSAINENGSIEFDDTVFAVVSRFDQSVSIQTAAIASLLLQICLLGTILGGLSILRRDAEVLVLGPLRRMLKIVARYARNPLVTPKLQKRSSRNSKSSGKLTNSDDSETSFESDSSDDDDEYTEQALGSFETEQLITAVAKITDLLRKCWGVAGADIISTNLATREGALAEVFNPTVAGKSVYALFAFAAIGGFDNALRNLGGDVMPLINDVAAVLHGEVFRWGFGDSGQCNKNLGGAFLMVFRIGLVKEVIERLEQATDVVFSTDKREKASPAVRRRINSRNSSSLRSQDSLGNRSSHSFGPVSSSRYGSGPIRRNARRNHSTSSTKAMSLSLQSLPGIGTFTDRAVIGMLKSYAGIYRDKKVLNWNNDLRLGAGSGAFNISMIFGMDAGWAVEGAVGSEYKIDATYLSPHVNMASRMTSACKQYDVKIMLSQAVQELMTDVAQSKLRHLDTVTVKGSSVKQKIYTYDARARGVDFFLHSRSEQQADYEADHYSPSTWNTDQDLIAMRQHVTDDFLKAFKEGHKAYSSGDWTTALEKLEFANETMFKTAVDEGYLEDEFDALNLRPGADIKEVGEDLKRDYGDGPSMCLISYMKSLGGVAPTDWAGWHPLTRK